MHTHLYTLAQIFVPADPSDVVIRRVTTELRGKSTVNRDPLLKRSDRGKSSNRKKEDGNVQKRITFRDWALRRWSLLTSVLKEKRMQGGFPWSQKIEKILCWCQLWSLTKKRKKVSLMFDQDLWQEKESVSVSDLHCFRWTFQPFTNNQNGFYSSGILPERRTTTRTQRNFGHQSCFHKLSKLFFFKFF